MARRAKCAQALALQIVLACVGGLDHKRAAVQGGSPPLTPLDKDAQVIAATLEETPTDPTD